MRHDAHATGGRDPRPRLVFAVRELPLPPRSGAPLRTHRLATGLAEAFAVTLVTFEHAASSSHDPVTREELAAGLPGIDVVTVPGLRAPKRLGQLGSLARRRSWEFGRYARPAMARALRQAVARTAAPLVHLDDVGMGLVAPASGVLRAFAPHNVEHRILAGTAAAASGTRARFAALDARRLAAEEQRLWRSADLCVAVSELDAEAMRAGGAGTVVVAPNGADPVDLLPAPRRAPDEPLRILFVGAGDYWPNGQGIAWMVDEVLPRLRGAMPVAFDVVGRPPADPVAADGVTYHGRVDDLRPFYERAHAVVAPLFLGSGTRLKVVEAMAQGRPLVATSVGAEGVPAVPGEHFLQADDAEGFAAALTGLGRRLADGDPGVPAMLAAARAAVEPLFWPRIAAGLAGTYLDAIERAGARRPRAPSAAGPARA
jgi:glycosyltransferase involved in cell wall biosynthesis